MLVLSSPEAVSQTAAQWKTAGLIALVPTMGALHDGHLKLISRAKEMAARVMVSIFVNPLQFGPKEDFTKYPRPFENDREKCEAAGVDLLFHPEVKDFYPEGFRTRVSVGELSLPLEGQSRPGHFDGVATVCLKLFQVSRADIAVFGEKDFQQLRVLQQMVTDLNLPIRLIPYPIVREADGLALSSRNRYLSAEERRWASQIPAALKAVASLGEQFPATTVGEVINTAHSVLTSVPLQVDYLTVAQANDLKPVAEAVKLESLESPRLFVAVKAGTTRLIDNLALKG